MTIKCLFLGYTKKETKLIKLLENKGCEVKNLSRKIKIHDTKGFHLFISFGYRHIITEKIIKKIKGPLINLHLSYLPYNRGAHPNFWSFVDNAPSGVSIVEIDKGIDTGSIIYQDTTQVKSDDNFITYPLYQYALAIPLLKQVLEDLRLKLESKSIRTLGLPPLR